MGVLRLGEKMCAGTASICSTGMAKRVIDCTRLDYYFTIKVNVVAWLVEPEFPVSVRV